MPFRVLIHDNKCYMLQDLEQKTYFNLNTYFSIISTEGTDEKIQKVGLEMWNVQFKFLFSRSFNTN